MVLVGGMAQRTRKRPASHGGAMTREEEQLETCGVRGQLRGWLRLTVVARGRGEAGAETRTCDWAWVWGR